MSLDLGEVLHSIQPHMIRRSHYSALLSWTLQQCKSTFYTLEPYLIYVRLLTPNPYSGNIDTTGVQSLVDTHKELERWSDAPVEFHFANILSPWVRRGLVAGGFGTGDETSPVEVAPVVQNEEFADSNAAPDWRIEPSSSKGNRKSGDVEGGDDDDVYKKGKTESSTGSTEGPLLSALTPFFHVDLPSAVKAAETNALKRNGS